MDKRERPDRKRRETKPLDPGSGEGAASALSTLRALERKRDACAPVEEIQPPSAEGRRAPKPGTP